MNVRSIEGLLQEKINPLNEDDALALLAAGAPMLVASSSHAADWKRRFIQSQTEEETRVCATPAITFWNQWIGELAHDCAEIPIPLTPLQEMQLWEQVIDADKSVSGNTASAHGLARHAAEAYSMLREYRISTEELTDAGEEAEALKRWSAAIHDALKRKTRVLSADLPALLLPHITAVVKHTRILLDGFDRFTPMQQSLLLALHRHGVSLCSIRPARTMPTLTLTATADAETEYSLLAQRLAEATDAAPHARIGVAISRQVKDPETVRRILAERLLAPSEMLASVQTSMQAVTMAGPPLADAPLIRQLLNVLRLAGHSGAPCKALSSLLFSPGIRGFAEERLLRAALDAKLREGNRHYLTFKSLLAMNEMEAMPQLAIALRGLLDWEGSTRVASAWVKATLGLLQTTGFLQVDATGRSGSEIRQLNAFRDTLASLVAIDTVRGAISWNSFLSLLAAACNAIALPLPARHPQVSLMPLEQMAGARFDLLFVVGLDDEALPLPARPTPLLPFALQRRHKLPGATAAIAFAESERLWQQLLRAAPVVQVSYARLREERELRPSPFLNGIDALPYNRAPSQPEALETEPFEGTPAVPVTAAESVRGGSAIIRNQSACPFRAFAAHRLKLAPLGETEPGIKAADKGSLLHQALEYIWQQLRSQSALLALDAHAATALIHAAVEHAWQSARVTAPESAQQFERRRMQAVLTAWLEIERKRPPFSVTCCEKPYRLELPESGVVRFAVNLKADRIDRDAEGHKILIDYKTGQKQSPGKWIGERMAEPQLPLYAVAEVLGENDAVCFARVRSGDMAFEGLSGEATGIEKISIYKGGDEEAETWTDLLACWRQRINALATEFVAGRCDVSPRDANACAYCGLEALCRIDEIGIDRDEEDEA